MDISFSDSEESGPDLTDNTVKDGNTLSCEVCSIPIVYSGRGPYPKFCDDHKKQPAKSRKSGKNVDTLIEQIGELYMATGALLSMFPATATDSMLVASSATTLAESWRPLIESDAKVRKFFERLVTGGGWGAVIMAHGTLSIGIMRAHNISFPAFGSQQKGREDTQT